MMRDTRRSLVALALATILLTLPTGLLAQGPASSGRESFDIRLAKDAGSTGYIARFGARASDAGPAALARGRATGLARLQANFQVDVENSPELGTPEVVSTKPAAPFLTPPGTDRVRYMRTFLSTYADAFGLTAAEINNLAVVAEYQNPAGNVAWVELEQRLNGLPVFRGTVRGAFTARGELARTTGPLASGLDPRSLSTTPRITPEQAVALAAQSAGWGVPATTLVQKSVENGRITFNRGPMADDAKAWLLYFPLAPGVARLAWSTEYGVTPTLS